MMSRSPGAMTGMMGGMLRNGPNPAPALAAPAGARARRITARIRTSRRLPWLLALRAEG